MTKHTAPSETSSPGSPPEHARMVIELLEDAYGPATWTPSHKPVDELVATILSQNTSDTNTERAFQALKTRYADWQAVRDAPTDDVADTIRAGGLADQKAPRIQRVLDEILDDDAPDQNQQFLSELQSRQLDNAMDWLTSFTGVGPKTAACVLLFAAGMPALPVDTHVHRVAGRLGLIEPDVNAERAHELLRNRVPPEDAYRFHVHMIAHGRLVCKSRKPRCDTCILAHICTYRRGLVEST